MAAVLLISKCNGCCMQQILGFDACTSVKNSIEEQGRIIYLWMSRHPRQVIAFFPSIAGHSGEELRVQTLSWSPRSKVCVPMASYEHAGSRSKASLGFIPTQRRSVGGPRWSSRWSYSCFLLSCCGSVFFWLSSAEPGAPWTERQTKADSRPPPGRKSSRKSVCSRTETLWNANNNGKILY